MKGKRAQMLVLAAMVIAMSVYAAEPRHPQSILQERTPTVTLLLKSASTGAPMAEVTVEVLERVVCEQAPCPPVVAWKGRTNRRGVADVPTIHLREATLVRVEGFGSREAAASEFHTDDHAWTLHLVPDGPIACGTADDQWTIRLARDSRSAEVREHDRALRFGVLSCSAAGAELPHCSSPDVDDAGYIAVFSKQDGKLRVKISADSIRGARTLAELACRETR